MNLKGFSQGIKIGEIQKATVLISKLDECDTLLKEAGVKIDALKGNEADCKDRLDSSRLASKMKDKVINSQMAIIGRKTRNGAMWRNFGLGVVAYAIIREGLNYLKELR